jgi:uncharacterized protein YndB with AHSA1/START domain
MVSLEVSVVINRPIDEVFAYLADEENNLTWRSGTVEAKKTSVGPVGVGTIYRVTNITMGRRFEGQAEVIEYEPNRHYATRNRSGLPVETKRTFEPVDGGTRVTFTVKADLTGVFRSAEPLFENIGRRRLESDVADLKDLLEHGAQ